MKNGEQPAFANPGSDLGAGSIGLSKREYFAAIAMQGLCANGYSNASGNASAAVAMADELLKHLES